MHTYLLTDLLGGRLTALAHALTFIWLEKSPCLNPGGLLFNSPMSWCTSSADFTFGFDALVLVLSPAGIGRWMMVHNTGNESLKGIYAISFYR